MKKIWIGACLSLAFLGFSTSAFADASAAPACGYSTEEATFAGQLSNENQMVFCGMTANDRAACMAMVGTPDSSGNPMTGDDVVMKMSGGQ